MLNRSLLIPPSDITLEQICFMLAVVAFERFVIS
jgi:hypothetical protein